MNITALSRVDLARQVAPVTGAVPGIGAAPAKGPAEPGHDLLLVAQGTALLSHEAEKVRVLGGVAIYLRAPASAYVTGPTICVDNDGLASI